MLQPHLLFCHLMLAGLATPAAAAAAFKALSAAAAQRPHHSVIALLTRLTMMFNPII
jgi:hypothetical protein